jgi:inner membrane protein
MCSVFTHPVVPAAIAAVFPQGSISPTLVLLGAACSIIPDLDVIGFKFGIRYGDMLGHRGLTHSIFFAAVLAASLALLLPQSGQGSRLVVFLFLFLSMLSHAILDAMTDGGLGVAFFAPFHNERYFFPWRPIAVSPIGMGFFSERGLEMIISELRWVWLPSAIVVVLM